MSAHGLTQSEVLDWIEERIVERRISRAALAKLMGVNESTLRKALGGKGRNGSLTEHSRTLALAVQALGAKLLFEYDIVEECEE